MQQTTKRPPPPQRLLPVRAASLPDIPHPEIPYLDGAGWEIGRHLGSGIDKSAYLLIDGNGEPRSDVVLKVAKHSAHCDDNRQCKNEIEMWKWLVKVRHPFSCYFAAVEAIVQNIEVLENGETLIRTCYLSEKCETVGGYGNGGTDIREMKRLLTSYFGIYDLHNNNVGHTEDGRAVVLDFGLFAGFDRVQAQWDRAVEANPDYTPQEVLDSIEPLNPDDCEPDTDGVWCDECDTNVSEDHCHCTECDRERRGGDNCDDCNTITNETSRLTHTEWNTSRILCATCLRDARADREANRTTTTTPEPTAPEPHQYTETEWEYHPSCGCDECRNEKANRMYGQMRISVHRIESAPSLPKLNIGTDRS